MKRLYVVPAARGRGLGEALVAAIVREAGRIGYREMKLDTLASMAGALALYGKFGFSRIAAYYDTPVPDTVFMSRTL
jgi:ribosomal protein S18 acetylase RimI-like enzyme